MQVLPAEDINKNMNNIVISHKLSKMMNFEFENIIEKNGNTFKLMLNLGFHDFKISFITLF